MEVLSNIPDQVSIQVVIHSYSSRLLVFGGAFWYALPELTQFTQLYSYMHTQINQTTHFRELKGAPCQKRSLL